MKVPRGRGPVQPLYSESDCTVCAILYKDEGSITTLGILSQCSFTLTNIFLEFKWYFIYFCLCLLPLVLSLGATKKNPSSLPHMHQVFQNIDGSSLSLLFSWLSIPCFLTLSSQERALDGLCGPLLGLFLCSHVVLALGSPACGDSAPDASQQCWVEWKSHISQPFCNILPTTTSVGLFFCHKSTLLTHVQLVDYQDAQISLCQAAFQLGRPQLVLMWGFIPPQVQDLAFFRRFLSVQFSSLSASLWTAAHASGRSTTPPSFVSSSICINVHKLLYCI